MATTIQELKQRQDTKDAANAKLGEQHTVTDEKWEIYLPKTRICTLEQLIEHCRIDLVEWRVERAVFNKWEMGAKDKTDTLVVEPLFQVKAFCVRNKEASAVRKEIEELKAAGMKALAKMKFAMVKPRKPSSGNMLEISTYDLHLGKLCWSPETGGPNYDTKIAVETYWRAFNTLLDRVGHHRFDLVTFVIGNDLLQADNPDGRTTAGTYVSTDGRYEKTFSIARDLKIESILRLRARFKCKIKVILVRGNHDSQSIFSLGSSLEMFFASCKEVEVDNLPRTRKYVKWGKVMIMLTHGHRGKKADFPLLMATEQSELFGATKFREVHTGHLHKRYLDENHGIRVRILSSLTPADSWHADMGFVGNLPCAEAFVWNKDEGLIGTAEFTDIAQLEVARADRDLYEKRF